MVTSVLITGSLSPSGLQEKLFVNMISFVPSVQLLEDAPSGDSLNFLDSPSTCKAVGRALPTLSAQVSQTLFFTDTCLPDGH